VRSALLSQDARPTVRSALNIVSMHAGGWHPFGSSGPHVCRPWHDWFALFARRRPRGAPSVGLQLVAGCEYSAPRALQDDLFHTSGDAAFVVRLNFCASYKIHGNESLPSVLFYVLRLETHGKDKSLPCVSVRRLPCVLLQRTANFFF
jgi:hypothetical protein